MGAPEISAKNAGRFTAATGREMVVARLPAGQVGSGHAGMGKLPSSPAANMHVVSLRLGVLSP